MSRILIGNIKGPQGDVGPQGPTGPQGPAGPQGPLPSLINNALATTAGVAALDAAMGPTFQSQINTLNSNLIKTVLITVDITTQTAPGVALGAFAYQQVITSDGILAGKTILGACVEGVRSKSVGGEVGIGAIETSNGYVYINTLTAGAYAVRVRVYYK